VVPILLPDVETTLRFTRMLHDDGVYVNAAVYPAVSALRPRVLINVGANLEPEEIERALASIARTAAALHLGA
jgi:7-keto-8-aminopelargonate synthetase-like enzyme